MYVLHYAPDNASLIIRLALEELNLPYRTALVDRSIRAQDSARFRDINPVGRIPALETVQGPIFETAAILLYLSDRHGALAPNVAAQARGTFLSWLFFVSNTLHADLRMMFYPEAYAGPDHAAQHALHNAMSLRLAGHFDLLDSLAGQGKDWFNGPSVSVLDLYSVVLMRWSRLYARLGTGWFDQARYPALNALALQLEQRAAVQAASRAEGLGGTPFSDPVLPRPPEGAVM